MAPPTTSDCVAPKKSIDRCLSKRDAIFRETQPRRTRQPVAVSVAAAMLSASNPTFSAPAQSTLSFCGELGRLDGNQRHCCSVDCKRCGGIGCGLKENGPGARECCPVRWEAPVPPCTSFQRTRCKLASPPAHRVHAPLRLHNHSSHTNRTGVPCAVSYTHLTLPTKA